MAEVILKDIVKIYPYVEKKEKKRAKKVDEQPKKKTNLQITDKGVVAVQQFNLHIKDGEFIVLVGPSGCGKSTTLRMVAGLEDISEGELYIGGKLVNAIEPKDRDIAMVFQSYALYPHMSVYDNMAYSLKIRKFPYEVEYTPEERAKNADKAKALEAKIELTHQKGVAKINAAKAKADSIVPANEAKLAELVKALETADEAGKAKIKAEMKKCNKAIDKAKYDVEYAVALAEFNDNELKEKIDHLYNDTMQTKHRKLSKQEIDEKVKEAAEILNITEYLQRKPKNLSGGQRQRVAIGRAIVRKPKALLMDEPLSNLDAKLRNQMRAEIIKLRSKINTTFIYVTHDQIEAMTLGDRIVVMKDGFIQQIGTPQEVFDHPRNKFVSGFIGTPQMNYFEAKLTVENGDYYVVVGDYKVKVSKEKKARLLANKVEAQDITIGVRPDHMDITDKGIAGKIEVSELMGTSYHLHLTVDGKDVIVIKSNKDGSENFVGKEIHLGFTGDIVHIFSNENGKNLEYFYDNPSTDEKVELPEDKAVEEAPAPVVEETPAVEEAPVVTEEKPVKKTTTRKPRAKKAETPAE